MKKFFMLLLAFGLLLALALPALAGEERVVDEGNLLSITEEAHLQRRIDQIKAEYQIDIAIVTQMSIGLRSPHMFAADYYDDHGYGMGANRDGIIFLVAMASRDYFTATTGRAMDIFTDSKLDNLHESMVHLLSRRDYYDAMKAYLDGVEKILKGSTPWGRMLSVAPIILLAGLGIGLAVAFGFKSQLKTVRRKADAISYMVRSSFRLTKSQDIYLYTTTRRVKIETNVNVSGGGGGGSFRSSGGRSFGGSGGKF